MNQMQYPTTARDNGRGRRRSSISLPIGRRLVKQASLRVTPSFSVPIQLIVIMVSLLIFTPCVLFSGADEEIKKKQEELTKLRTEIESYEERIQESERRESSTLELLDDYDRQALLLRKLTNSLREEEQKLQREIEETRKRIDELKGQISFVKRHYAKYVQSAYKYGRTYDLELLFSSRSINQVYLRAYYLQRFSEQRKRDLVKIQKKRKETEYENLALQVQLTKEHELIAEKSREETRLQSKVQQRKNLLADIRKNKVNYHHELERRRTAARDIGQIIAKLIEEERLRKERDTVGVGERKEPVLEVEGSSVSFETRRGKLRWPVAQGRLAARYGNQQHPVLRTVTQNTGIDISVPAGTDVLAIAAGEVSTIWWLPSFGNLVILNHYNGYRTVYAHLSEINVREGEQVTEGTSIGKSGESLAGPTVHFEVWKFRDKQDPEIWLHPQGLSQR